MTTYSHTITCTSRNTKASLGSYPQKATATITLQIDYDTNTNNSAITVSSFSATNTSTHFTGTTRNDAGRISIAIGKDSTGAGSDAYYEIGKVKLPNGSTDATGDLTKQTPWNRKHDKNGNLNITVWAQITSGDGNYVNDTYVYSDGDPNSNTLYINETATIAPEAPSLKFVSAPGFENCLSYQNNTYQVYDGSKIDLTITPGAAGSNVEFLAQYVEYQPKPIEDIYFLTPTGEPRKTKPGTFEGWKPKSSHSGSSSYVVRAVEAYKVDGVKKYAVRDYNFKILPKPAIPRITKKPEVFQVPREITDTFDLVINCTGIGEATSPAKITKYSGSIYEHYNGSVTLKESYNNVTASDDWTCTIHDCKPETKYGITVYAHDNLGQKSVKDTTFDYYITTDSHQAKLWYRVGGQWQLGKVWYKEAGTWKKVKKAYIKDSTGWKKAK